MRRHFFKQLSYFIQLEETFTLIACAIFIVGFFNKSFAFMEDRLVSLFLNGKRKALTQPAKRQIEGPLIFGANALPHWEKIGGTYPNKADIVLEAMQVAKGEFCHLNPL